LFGCVSTVSNGCVVATRDRSCARVDDGAVREEKEGCLRRRIRRITEAG
jgi:hypothetical protein